MTVDSANGYEGIAEIFIARRGQRPTVGDAIGAATIRAWAENPSSWQPFVSPLVVVVKH